LTCGSKIIVYSCLAISLEVLGLLIQVLCTHISATILLCTGFHGEGGYLGNDKMLQVYQSGTAILILDFGITPKVTALFISQFRLSLLSVSQPAINE